MIYKYSGTSLPISFTTKEGTHCVKVSEKDFVILKTGDYAFLLNGHAKVVTQTEYQNDELLKRLVVERVAIGLLEDMIQALQDLAVTDAVKLDLLKTVDVVLIMVVGNKIQAARTICNATPTTANFTTARKNALLSLMDTAILLL